MLDPSAPIPPGYVVAPATWEDLAAVAVLMAAVDQADYGETVFGEDFIRGEWNRPRFDLSTDTLVLRDGAGEIRAYAEAFDEDVPDVMQGIGVVHPEHRGRGLGVALISAQEGRAARQAGERAGGPVRLHTAVAAPDVAARALLRARGYQAVRSFFHMEADPRQVGDPPAPPAGIDVRPFAPGGDDEWALHKVLQESFRGQWGHQEIPFDEWRTRQESSGFDPSLCWLATERGRVVGAVEAGQMADEGWISELAVLPAWRRRGIGSFLLRLAFAELRDRGFDRVLLNVDTDNESGAVGLYEHVGMRVRRQWDLYEMVIGGVPEITRGDAARTESPRRARSGRSGRPPVRGVRPPSAGPGEH